MATGSQGLETLRGAYEVAEGDGTTPTRLLYVPQGSIKLLRKKESIEIDLAWAKFDQVQDILSGIEDVTVQLTDVPMSFEDAGWLLGAFDGSFGETPATTDTTAFTRTGAFSQTDNTISATGQRSLALQWAPNDFIGTRGWKLPGLVGEDLVITFRKRASGNDTGVRVTAQFRTASPATAITALTGSLSDRAQTWAIGNMLKSYIDTSTMGSTADAAVIEAIYHLNRPAVFHDGMDNTGNHTTMHRPKPWMTELTITRKFSDVTEDDAYLGAAGIKTLRKVRIIAEGAVVGATTAKNTIKLDFVGKHTDDGDKPLYIDGLMYQTLHLQGMMDTTLGASSKLVTINTIATAYKTA